MNNKNNAIELIGVSKKFRKYSAVTDANLVVSSGKIFGLLGPNGCGKSTIIRMMSGLLYPDSGTVKVMGKDPSEVRSLINRVSVEASFFKKLTAIENLLYAGRMYGLSFSEIKARIDSLSESLNFPKRKLEISMEKLSRGLQQKVAIMRGFMSKPQVVFLDEPTTGLDPSAKLDVQKFVKEYLKTGATMILTTHDMDEVERLCDYVVLMHSGRIIEQGTSNQLKSKLGKVSLEEVFVHLTGMSLEEENEQ